MALSTSATALWTSCPPGRECERPSSTVGLGNVRPALTHRLRLVTAAVDPVAQLAEIVRKPSFVGLHRHPDHPGRRLPPQPPERSFERLDVHVVQQRREPGLAQPSGRVVHPDEMIRIGPTLCSVLQFLARAPHQSRASLRSTRCLRRQSKRGCEITSQVDVGSHEPTLSLMFWIVVSLRVALPRLRLGAILVASKGAEADPAAGSAKSLAEMANRSADR
jgi:hypothetical protein